MPIAPVFQMLAAVVVPDGALSDQHVAARRDGNQRKRAEAHVAGFLLTIPTDRYREQKCHGQFQQMRDVRKPSEVLQNTRSFACQPYMTTAPTCMHVRQSPARMCETGRTAVSLR